MITKLQNLKGHIKFYFYSPVRNNRQTFIIVIVAVIFASMPQYPPMDWDLNTSNFWADIPNTYSNPNFVYPPWGLILMIPYWLMQSYGARFASVLTIGWLVSRGKWSISHFLAIVLSPYFLVTMLKSNMDILVFVFPLLLWEQTAGTKMQNIGWGLALSILLLKPQGAILIYIYLIYSFVKNWKELIVPVGIVGLITIPISFIGKPLLLVQWINNLLHPSPQNQLYWSLNNISISQHSLWRALLILFLIALLLYFLTRFKFIIWTKYHTIASIFLVSMFLSPYTSQQSLSSALSFVPSWGAVIVELLIIGLGLKFNFYINYQPVLILLISVLSLYFFRPIRNN